MEAATDRELLGHLFSRSAVTRINAQRVLLRRKRASEAEILSRLEEAAANPTYELYGRVAVLFTIAQLDEIDPTQALLRLGQDSSLREYALRALADEPSVNAVIPDQPLAAALNDPNPRVRLQSLIALARLGKTAHVMPMLQLARDPAGTPGPPEGFAKGHYAIPHTAVKAVAHLGDAKACAAALHADATLAPQVFRCLQQIHTAESVDVLASLLENESHRLAALSALFRLYHQDKHWDGTGWWSTRPDDRGPYFDPITWEQSPRIRSLIEEVFPELPPSSHDALLTGMKRNRIDARKWQLGIVVDKVAELLENGDIQLDHLTSLTEAAKGQGSRGRATHSIGQCRRIFAH